MRSPTLLLCLLTPTSWQPELTGDEDNSDSSTKTDSRGPPRRHVRVVSPCHAGTLAIDNAVEVTVNGCGSSWWHRHIANLLPYNSRMEECCNQHDRCFSDCASVAFTEAFTACNNLFRICLHNKCPSLLSTEGQSFWKKLREYGKCRATAEAFYHAVRLFGAGPYNESQERRCDCF